jgi:hypothetical protein
MQKLRVLGAAALAAPAAVFAAVPTEVTTALTDGKADAITIATGVLLIVFAIAVFRWMRAAK